MSVQMAKGESLSRPWGLNRSPPRNRVVVPLHWAQHGRTGHSGHIYQTLDLSVRSPDGSHVSRTQWSLELTGCCAITDRTLSHQRLVISSKVPEMLFAHRTRPVKHDRTLPSSDNRTGHTLPAFDRSRPNVWSFDRHQRLCCYN